MTDTPTHSVSEEEIARAIAEGSKRYFRHCRERIPDFVNRHFAYPGAIQTNRVALGWDLLPAPLNLFWAPFYALICVLRYFAGKSQRFDGVHNILSCVPAGLTTKVQKNISSLVINELLMHSSNQYSIRDHIIEELETLYQSHNPGIVTHQQFQLTVEPLVNEALIQYQVTRTASADITNTLSCAVLGAFAFKKFTPGGIGMGIVLASIIAKEAAVREFIFGKTIGAIYYAWFPPEPSVTLLSVSTLAVMAVLSAIAAFSGILTDPIQARMGLHQRRLRKLANHLEKDFQFKTGSSFRPKDQFVARILDAFDMIRSSLP